MDKFTLSLVVLGALNWASMGVFQFDFIAGLFGSSAAVLSRIVYTLIGAGGLWQLSLLFFEKSRRRE